MWALLLLLSPIQSSRGRCEALPTHLKNSCLSDLLPPNCSSLDLSIHPRCSFPDTLPLQVVIGSLLGVTLYMVSDFLLHAMPIFGSIPRGSNPRDDI